MALAGGRGGGGGIFRFQVRVGVVGRGGGARQCAAAEGAVQGDVASASVVVLGGVVSAAFGWGGAVGLVVTVGQRSGSRSGVRAGVSVRHGAASALPAAVTTAVWRRRVSVGVRFQMGEGRRDGRVVAAPL